MIKFEEGKLYCFKAADLSRMFGECLERNDMCDSRWVSE